MLESATTRPWPAPRDLGIAAILALLFALAGCASEPAHETPEPRAPGADGSVAAAEADAGFTPLDPPAGPGAMAPYLRVGSRGVLLVWIEPVDARFAEQGLGWTESSALVASPQRQTRMRNLRIRTDFRCLDEPR